MDFMTQITSDIVERCRHVPLHYLVGDVHVSRKVKILCPFHSERTPSCILFPTGGYKCFACPAHGNSLDFVMNIGATFEEGINELIKYI